MKRILTVGLFILTAAAASLAQNPADCNSNGEDDNIAAVYNFVPENVLLADFRRLSKTEEGFVSALQKTPDAFVEDHTTQVLSEEMMPELPPVSDQLIPSPSESGANFFFNGKITKTSAGFLLTTNLHKASDNSLLNEVQTPFANADDAETAGTTAAAQMLSFLATQTQASRADRATSNQVIKPVITLHVDKFRVKPSEPDPAKITLTDCDGMPLKNRQFEIQSKLSQGETILDEHQPTTRTTDDKGIYTGSYAALAPGVLTSIVRFKYTDLQGRPQEATDSVSIVVDGGAPDLWQMSVRWQYFERDRYLAKDLQTGRTAIGSGQVKRKGDFIFLFKVPTSSDGAVFTNEIQSFNGFGEAFDRLVREDFDHGLEKHFAYGIFDQKPDSIANMQAGFSIDPANKEFQFSVSSIPFRGGRDSIGCGSIGGEYSCNSKHDEFVVTSDGADKLGGEIPITPEMIRSGVYTYSFEEKKQLPANHTRSAITDQTSEGSYVYNRVEIKVSRVNPNRGKIID